VGDLGRLRQVLLNLIGNAIKFTERGEILITVGTESRKQGEAVLSFTVSDTGIGIPENQLRVIFEPFKQADGGTGLGLTISARLAALMWGGISAESECGKGSSFRFTARLGVVEAESGLTSEFKAEETEKPRASVGAYVDKPDRQSQLLNAIEGVIASESIGRLDAFTQSSGKVGNMTIIQEAIPAVSFDGSLFDGDPDFLAEIVNLFLDTYPELLSDIQNAITQKDAVVLRRAAHTLKGAVANFGAKTVVEQAKAIEMMGKDSDFESASRAMPGLRLRLEEFVPELQAALVKGIG
jgi:HPt (histidine-containing phosphotransfer) domain-containing protein